MYDDKVVEDSGHQPDEPQPESEGVVSIGQPEPAPEVVISDRRGNRLALSMAEAREYATMILVATTTAPAVLAVNPNVGFVLATAARQTGTADSVAIRDSSGGSVQLSWSEMNEIALQALQASLGGRP